MKPWEFERLQPQEFYLLLDGYEWRKEKNEDVTAYFVSNLMNVEGKSLKNPITCTELVSPLRSRKNDKTEEKKKDEMHLQGVFAEMLGGESD